MQDFESSRFCEQGEIACDRRKNRIELIHKLRCPTIPVHWLSAGSHCSHSWMSICAYTHRVKRGAPPDGPRRFQADGLRTPTLALGVPLNCPAGCESLRKNSPA